MSFGIKYRLREDILQNKLKPPYTSFIIPYLLYCNLALDGTCSTYSDRVYRLQKRVICISTGSSYRCHINDSFKECEVLKTSETNDVKLGFYMFTLQSRDEWLRKQCFNTR